jgi:hypothetical protein
MLIRIFSPTECGLIHDADLKKCGLNRMITVSHSWSLWKGLEEEVHWLGFMAFKLAV